MKKFILVFALALLLASPVAFASDEEVVITGNGDPKAVVQAWGSTMYQSTVVEVGTVIHVGYGLADEICQAWYPKHMGCVDLTSTEYWFKQLRALGINI